MNRGYVDFERLFNFTLSSAFFVVHTKGNVLLQRRYSHPVDKSTSVRSDQTVILATTGSATAYQDALRHVSYFDAVTGKRLKFLTNNFSMPALTIAQIYKQRWQVELFFKWIKQHLRIKAFFGNFPMSLGSVFRGGSITRELQLPLVEFSGGRSYLELHGIAQFFDCKCCVNLEISLMSGIINRIGLKKEIPAQILRQT